MLVGQCRRRQTEYLFSLDKFNLQIVVEHIGVVRSQGVSLLGMPKPVYTSDLTAQNTAAPSPCGRRFKLADCIKGGGSCTLLAKPQYADTPHYAIREIRLQFIWN